MPDSGSILDSSGSSVGKDSSCNARDPSLNSWVGEIPWRRARLPTLVFLGFPGGLDGKESACNVGDLGLIPGLGRSPGEGNGCSSTLVWRTAWTEELGRL